MDALSEFLNVFLQFQEFESLLRLCERLLNDIHRRVEHRKPVVMAIQQSSFRGAPGYQSDVYKICLDRVIGQDRAGSNLEVFGVVLSNLTIDVAFFWVKTGFGQVDSLRKLCDRVSGGPRRC